MEEWQLRIIIERAELQIKRLKLEAFMRSPRFTQLPSMDQDLLTEQDAHMHNYVVILSERIKRF